MGNKTEKIENRIEGVALKLRNGEIVSLPKPARHPSLFLLCQNLKKDTYGHEQGFVDSGDNFLTREEALAVADYAAQIIAVRRNPSDPRLFSEDIW